MELRGCFSLSDNQDGRQLKWNPDGHHGHFTGHWDFHANIRLDLALKVSKNVSFVEETKMGTRINATHFDGCLGRLQSGTSDFIDYTSAFLDYISAPGIQIGTCQSSVSIGFLSTYDPVISSKKQELVHTVVSISPHVWTIVMFITFLTSAAMALGIISIAKTKNCSESVQSVSNLAIRMLVATSTLLFKLLIKRPGDDAYGLNRVFFKFLILMIILLGFYVNFYVTAIIKKDAVNLKRPVTIESYDDIISSNVRPVFRKKYRDNIPFKKAGKETKRGLIWQKAVEMGIEKSVVQSIDVNEFSAGQSVIFLSQRTETPFMGLITACKRRRVSGAVLLPIFRFDESESESLAFVVNSAHLDKKFAHALHIAYEKLLEAGLSGINQRMLDGMMEMKLEDKVCTDNRIVMPDAGFSPIRVPQIRLLSFASIATLSFALFLLMSEQMLHHFLNARKKRIIQ